MSDELRLSNNTKFVLQISFLVKAPLFHSIIIKLVGKQNMIGQRELIKLVLKKSDDLSQNFAFSTSVFVFQLNDYRLVL